MNAEHGRFIGRTCRLIRDRSTADDAAAEAYETTVVVLTAGIMGEWSRRRTDVARLADVEWLCAQRLAVVNAWIERIEGTE